MQKFRLWLSFLILTFPLDAQVSTGSLSGTVLDPNAAAVPTAMVTAVHEATKQQFQTVTSDAGLYVFAGLPPGVYTITVEKSGFSKLTRENIEIRIAARQLLDLSLAVGNVTEVVEVTAQTPLLETTTSERGQSLSTLMMQNLPLFTLGIRNPKRLSATCPG